MNVSDNGLGMTMEQVERLFSTADHAPSRRRSGIGVKNVNERVRLYFGSGCGLAIRSEPDGGTTMVARLLAVSYEGLKEEVWYVK